MNIFLIVFLILHIGSSLAWFFTVRENKKTALFSLFFALCTPFVGLLCVWMSSRRVEEKRETPISRLYEIVEKNLMAANIGRTDLDAVVPFDEVLLLSNDESRREVMMHILRRDPFMYLEMLKTAKVSSDVEITHYATTTIMEIQRDLDISMQKAEEEFNKSPDDIDSVNHFISALSAYIDTGLLLENRKIQLQEQLRSILEHKISMYPNSRSAHLLLIENEINLGSYEYAGEIAARMCEKWPMDEVSWLKSLHVCMASGNAEEKIRIAEKIKTARVIWSRAGREEAEFLCDESIIDAAFGAEMQREA